MTQTRAAAARPRLALPRRHRSGGRNGCAGFGLVELSVSVVILATLTVGLIQHLSTTYQSIRHDRDTAFAYAKAQAILAEIQSIAAASEATASEAAETADLDELDDGGRKVATLTLTADENGLVAPDHPLSENTRRKAEWVWSRTVSVSPFQGALNRGLRQVGIKVFKRNRQGVDRVLADVATVVSTLSTVYPTTQVYDVFFLDVENVPGWWVMMESIGPFAEAVVGELQSQNPGLEFRTHWITKASYGRNEGYRPWLNVAEDSWQARPDVYWYPGRMPPGNQSTFYYPPSRFKAHMSLDGVAVGDFDPDANPHPYALADFYNHAMRYPQELALHERRVAAVRRRKAEIAEAKANRLPVPPPLHDMSEEPTLRLLLEDLNANPEKYRNALFVNLHGELVPFPSLRNYSDAAKLPDRLANVRVVTHPEELRTRRDPAHTGTDPVRLRVYAWTTEPGSYAGPPAMPDGMPILVQVMDMDLTDGAGGLRPGVMVESLRGGVDVGGTAAYWPVQPARHASDTGRVPGEMYYAVRFVDPGPGQRKFTLFELHQTPVVAPPVPDGSVTRGLAGNERSRLYGLEYVPSCTEAARDFSRDLYAPGDGPKNTARWTIQIPASSFAQKRFVRPDGTYEDPAKDVVLSVRTRIRNPALTDPFAGGRTWPTPVDPDNVSETYTWWATNAGAVPWTERAQFQGDPRHSPYRDLCQGDPDFPDGYNWFHSSLGDDGENAASDFPGLRAASLATSWDGRMAVDVPRFYELLRRGLVQSKCVFAAMNGWSFYYLGIGNEIGADSANGYPRSIPVTRGPWGSPGTDGYVNNITGTRHFVRSASTAPYLWWGIPWLGELYPDDSYSSHWLAKDAAGKTRGNLPAGTGAGTFFRSAAAQVYDHADSRFTAFGTDIGPFGHRTYQLGCTSFFNVGTATATFHHRPQNGTAVLSPTGEQLVTRYGLPMPTHSSANRPFSLAADWQGVANEWDHPPWTTNRYSASVFRRLFEPWTDAEAGAIVALHDPSATSSGFFVVNGLAMSRVVGTDLVAKISVVGALHGFLELGTTTDPSRPRPLPRVEIQAPTEFTELTDPGAIDVTWDITWRRWDGRKYTEGTSESFAENETELVYALMWSADNGHTWRYVQDDALARLGTLPDQLLHRIDDAQPGGAETYSLPTPAGTFPKGRYLLRVEAHRSDQHLHYSWHQTAMFIER